MQLTYVRFWCLGLAVLVVDQITKSWAGRFRDGAQKYMEVFDWDGFLSLNFTYVTNPGASFSMFSDYPEILTCLAVVALLSIWFFRQALEMDRLPLQFVFGGICGGIAGNLTDRLFRGGEVVDFIDFEFYFIPAYNGFWAGLRNFPIFNVADSAIFVGVVFYLYFGFQDARRNQAEVASNEASAEEV